MSIHFARNFRVGLHRIRPSQFLLSLILAAMVLVVRAAAGQSGGGSITGVVSDSSGAVIPNATIIARNKATGLAVQRTSTGSGVYNIQPLQVGDYFLIISAPTFGTETQENVHVDGLQVVSLNVTLRPGADVVVNVEAPALNAANATVGDSVSSQDYQLLPLVMNSAPRSPVAFVNLANGVDSTRGYNGGAVNYHNETYLDGVVASGINQQGAANNTGLSAIIEAVEQSEVQTVGISAKYQGQGFNNFTLKSGTNSWHGSAFEFFRNTSLDTWNYLSKSVINPATGQATKPVEKQNEYGFVVGGPIRKNKAFFFIGYERMAYRSLPNPSYFTLPTLAMRGLDSAGNQLPYADFSNYAAVTGYHIYDQTTTACINNGANCHRNQFPNDRIPRARLSPISLAAQQFLPTNLISQTLYQNNYLGSIGTGYNYYKASAKGDYQLTPTQRLTLAYLVGQRANSTGAFDSGNVLPLPYSATTNTTLFDNTGIIGHNWAITPHLVNDLKYSYFRNETIQADPSMQSKYALSTLGFQNAPPGWGAGSFIKAVFTGNYATQTFDGSGTTNNTNRPQNLLVNTYGLTDDVQWTRGRHNISLGIQYEWYQYNSALPATGTGVSFSFDNSTSAAFNGQDGTGATAPNGTSAVTTTSGNAYVGYLQGATTSAYVADQRNLGVLGGRFQAASPYVQDDWKVSKNLTLNGGLRWDIYGSYHEVQDRMSFFNPDIPNPVALGAKGAIEYNGFKSSSSYCQCRTRVKTYLGNIEPRLGFAYTVLDKTVVRGAFGISATHAGGTGGRGGAREGTNQIGLAATLNVAQTLGYDSPYNWNNPLFTPPPPTFDSTYGVGYVTSGGTTGAGSAVFYDEPYIASRSAYYENYSFGLQQALTSSTILSVDYSGSLGRFLPAATGNGIYSDQVNPMYLPLGTLLTSPVSGNITKLNTALAALGLSAFTLPYSNFNQAGTIGQALRPFPQFSISDNFQNYGKSTYNALEIALKQRTWHGLSLTVNYTFSRLLDDLANRPSAYSSTNAYNLDNGPHSLHIYGSWVTPHAASSHRLVRAVTGGWVVSSIFSYNSGNPLTYTTTCASQFSYFGACRATLNPNFTGSLRTNVPYGSANFKQAAFVPSTSSTANAPFITSATVFGNAPVSNAYGVKGPSTHDLDASLRRSFGPFEKVRLTIGADVFNVDNHVEATALSTAITSSAFGTASKQSNSSRDIQLNAKFEF
jgi:hypothetical protein